MSLEYFKAKISIIIPVYNVEKYLSKCLSSVINQTYKNLEIICVNDGSTDSSLKILEEFATNDNRIKILNKENGGLSRARNCGLSNATGDYCYFVDSDDWIELDTIEKLLSKMLSYNVDCVVHNVRVIAEEKSLEETSTDFQNWFLFMGKSNNCYKTPLNIRKEIIPVAWNKLYKMEIIIKYNCRFPDGLINEDEAFLWEYFIHCKNYYFLNEQLYNYLKRTNSIMGMKDSSIKILDILHIQKRIYNSIEKDNKIKIYKSALTDNYVNVVDNLFKIIPECFKKQAFRLIREYILTTNLDVKIIKVYMKYKYQLIYSFLRKITTFLKSVHFGT